MPGSFKDLKVYQSSFELAMEIFRVAKSFPKEETYSLTDQIRRSSRSVCSNIAEAYRKRRYPKHFLDFALDCGYIGAELHQSLSLRYGEVGKMLGSMADHPERFIPK